MNSSAVYDKHNIALQGLTSYDGTSFGPSKKKTPKSKFAKGSSTKQKKLDKFRSIDILKGTGKVMEESDDEEYMSDFKNT